ncbi:MAG: hypothetical protein DSY50_08110 [Desulfobulbus sp.]|nr:MAG: hypothetical protein DSY50_08110 [Desulfobulbus sp.]RUM41301.1 MAG: hypothetical protein DSY70_01530 [Desulfobulbus sp.]
MFTAIFSDLAQGVLPDREMLGRRFDVAMTKKLGVVKLPPSFWMQDSKINPRADHLLKVALLLEDEERCGLAVSVLAVEVAEKKYEQPLETLIEVAAADLEAVLPEGRHGRLQTIVRALLG